VPPGRIVLAVTGSIAAFKAASLASALIKDGMEVRVILTPGGERFVSRLTFEALTGNLAAVDIWEAESSPGSTRMGHIELAKWAETLVVAPATADAIARLALGLAGDLLGAVALVSRAPTIVAPAMESGMWQHPATQQHVRTLQERGAVIVGPSSGRLASGAEGEGRMSEPGEIRDAIYRVLQARNDLAGLRVLVTAGPTYEPIDPVRFIGNHSSGKMGYAVAEEARDRGATVTLISGPVSLPSPPGIDIVHVMTAEELRQEVMRRASESDVVVMAAAVADFRPAAIADHKMKRGTGMTLELAPTADIAAEASAFAPQAIHVGFALESRNLVTAARDKLRRKGQHLVVANAISGEHNPFGSDTNRVAFVDRNGVTELPEMAKSDVARQLWDRVLEIRRHRTSVSSMG
jgi:phosphopantothenoylcysteine decarboxylase/phosphopantothenate--cysteine ligase